MADQFYLARFRNAHEFGLKGSGRGTYEEALQDVFYAGSRHNETMHYIRTKKEFN